MKKLILTGFLAVIPFGTALAAVDYYLKIEGVEGESSSAAPSTTSVAPRSTGTESAGIEPDEIDVSVSGDDERKGNVETEWKVEEGESATDGEKGGTEDINIGVGELEEAGVEPDEIDARATGEERKGNVETGWKVEEGESLESTGVEPDEIDFMGEGEPLTTNFGILLGGTGDNDEGENEGVDEEQKETVLNVIFETAAADDVPMEEFSLNYGRIKTTVAQPVRLFGFIPVAAKARVEIDAENRVKVKFPWWAIFAAGEDGTTLGEQVFTTLSNALKHDTVKNAIQNIR